MVRMIFILHRYLGIGIGLLMLLWCLSGFVMMYVQYPEVDFRRKLENLTPLNTEACCRLPTLTTLDGDSFNGFHVEMLGDTPVLRLSGADGRQRTLDLKQGRELVRIDENMALKSAASFSVAAGLPSSFRYLGEIEVDQWTVYGSFNRHRPLHRFSAGDPGGTQWYVSSLTGEVVQITTAHERFWNYLGSVVHWLYPTIVRQNTFLWAQTVIWLSIIGVFLTGTGLYIGMRQYRSRANGRKSPYRGVSLWHHYVGLVFGVLTLTWVASGIVSMNPWGALESPGFQAERERLQGGRLVWADVQELIDTLSRGWWQDVVHLEAIVQEGNPYLLAYRADGQRSRLNPGTMQEAPLLATDLQRLGRRLLGGRLPLDSGMLDQEDAYYYHHHMKQEFPVYRIIADTPDRTRFYLDAVSGQIRAVVDGNRRWYRWLFHAFHRGDFSAALRVRPVWDLLMWPLLLGVTVVCATGTWMGLRRITISPKKMR